MNTADRGVRDAEHDAVVLLLFSLFWFVVFRFGCCRTVDNKETMLSEVEHRFVERSRVGTSLEAAWLHPGDCDALLSFSFFHFLVEDNRFCGNRGDAESKAVQMGDHVSIKEESEEEGRSTVNKAGNKSTTLYLESDLVVLTSSKKFCIW